jgi:hypothetical protein
MTLKPNYFAIEAEIWAFVEARKSQALWRRDYGLKHGDADMVASAEAELAGIGRWQAENPPPEV